MEPNKGTYALVTGGSSGMGLEYVRQLAKKGYNIIIVALYQSETDIVRDELMTQYPNLNIISIGIDLSTVNAAQVLFDKINAISPKIEVEILINNAGVLTPYHFVNMNYGQISRIILIHNHTLALLCHLFIPQMINRKKGYIMNISSLAAWLPYPFISTYSATKAFTRQLTRSLRCELRGSGVCVSTIYFGAVATNLYKIPQRWIDIAKKIGVMITPEKAAKVALNMMLKGSSGRIPGFVNKFAIFITSFIPLRLISVIEKRVTTHWNLK